MYAFQPSLNLFSLFHFATLVLYYFRKHTSILSAFFFFQSIMAMVHPLI
uniref:Uncharacterized protein n=1 Tax=Arundo donax TaxID=35708 RepID=A0A0A9GM65_ARUDO